MPAASDNAVPSNPLLPIGDLAVEGLSGETFRVDDLDRIAHFRPARMTDTLHRVVASTLLSLSNSVE